MLNSSFVQTSNRYYLLLVRCLLVLCIAFVSVDAYTQTVNYDIRLNQVGYYPNLEKKAYVVGGSSLTDFSVQSLDHATTFYTGTLQSGIADFSTFATPGNYVLNVPGIGYSAPFKINAEVFKDLSVASMKGYYYKRASTAITAANGGVYARAAGHPDTQVMIHSSAASVGRPVGTIVSSPKGWYDAGDYNCYVVNSNITTYTLLSAYEHFSSYYDTLKLNIPESGNGMPDILNEIKWNLDWMLTMQDPYDGGVYDKKTTANFSDFVMPAADVAQRYMVGKSRGSTYGFAAVMAVAYRIYLPYDPVYANKCLDASKKAYTTTATLGTGNNPSGITTGEYVSQSDERAWAGIELYISTKNENYYVPSYWTYCDFVPKWYEVNSVGLMSLVLHRKNLTTVGFADTTAIKNKLLGFASNTRSNTGYVSLFNSEWGGNSFALNAGMMDMCAYQLTKDRGYLNSAIFILDYVLGKNGTSYSFVTGFGSKTPMHPHDRISASDGVVEPVPGWVVGGGSSYVDVQDSYSTNEVAINWNAPLVFLTGAVQSANRGDKKAVLRILEGITFLSSNQTPALSFGSAIINTEANDKKTITISNSGTIPLLIKSITPTSGFVLSTLSAASPIAPGASSVFTITATPQNVGINTGKVTIETNDPETPVFIVNVTVKGKLLNQPYLEVLNGTDLIPSNNTSSVVVGSSLTGTVADPFTITLSNQGSVPLTINSITGTSGFKINTSSLNTTIAADGSSTFTITATPANAGVNSGVITIETNDPSNPIYTLNVTVIGLVPSLSIEEGNTIYKSNGDPYYFASIALGEQSYVAELKIRNSGTARLILNTPEITGPYSITGMPAYLEAGEVKTVGLIFTPTTIGTITGTVSFGSNAATTFILNVSGRGKAPDPLQMKISQGTTVFSTSNTRFEFPAVVLGTSGVPVVFTIANTGTAVLPVTNVSITGPFQLVQPFTATSIPVGSSITFAVVFKPTSLSSNSGTAIISATGISSFYLSFSGYGETPPAPGIKVLQNLTEYYNNATGYSFPATAIGSTSDEVIFTIRNTGNAVLTISDLTITGPFEFVQTFTAASIASGDSKTFSIVFKPTSSNTLGAVSITSNASSSPFLLNAYGTVNTSLTPIIKVNQGATAYTSNGTAFQFSATALGSTSDAVVFTIKNTGTAPLTLGTPAVTGPFQLTGLSATSVPAGSTTTFNIVFAPVTTGNITGSVSIPNNTSGSPFVLNLAGTSVVPIITVKQGSTPYSSNGAAYVFPPTTAGSSSTAVEFTITNPGSAALTLSAPVVTGPFQITGPSLSTVSAGGSTTFSVIFSPVTTGDVIGTISIANNTDGSPFVLNVSGTGTLATGTVGMLAADAIAISPNPTKQNISIQMKGTFNNVSVHIYNTVGELVLSTVLGDTNDATVPLLLTNVAAGMYLVEITTDQGSCMRRIVKE